MSRFKIITFVSLFGMTNALSGMKDRNTKQLQRDTSASTCNQPPELTNTPDSAMNPSAAEITSFVEKNKTNLVVNRTATANSNSEATSFVQGCGGRKREPNPTENCEERSSSPQESSEEIPLTENSSPASNCNHSDKEKRSGSKNSDLVKNSLQVIAPGLTTIETTREKFSELKITGFTVNHGDLWTKLIKLGFTGLVNPSRLQCLDASKLDSNRLKELQDLADNSGKTKKAKTQRHFTGFKDSLTSPSNLHYRSSENPWGNFKR